MYKKIKKNNLEKILTEVVFPHSVPTFGFEVFNKRINGNHGDPTVQ